MNSGQKLIERYAASIMPNYGQPPVALARGEGCWVWDADGERYLDLIGGIAVSSLGHGHPAIVAAVSRQVGLLAHTSNLFLHEPEVELAERLLSLLGGPGGSAEGRVFFANSGTEANEAALKVVRRFHDAHGGADRQVIVAAEQGFHGRTRGALALTGKASIRDPFGPFGLSVRFVPYGDEAALREAVDTGCAAVFLEPCQGEAGVVPAPAGYLRAAQAACDAAGALLVLDEIQSGIGRTGAWFAHQREDVRPDVLTLAKGLGGGLPIGACVGLGECGTVLGKGEHGSTFGGNPVACAAALAVLDTIAADDLLGHVTSLGSQLTEQIGAIGHPLLSGVRGQGLWLAVTLVSPHAELKHVASLVEVQCRTAGFLVNAVRPDAIRLAPPLILTSTQAELFTRTLPAILDVVAGVEWAGDHWFVSRPGTAVDAARQISKELGLLCRAVAAPPGCSGGPPATGVGASERWHGDRQGEISRSSIRSRDGGSRDDSAASGDQGRAAGADRRNPGAYPGALPGGTR